MNSFCFSTIITLLGSPLLCHSLRNTSSSQGERSESIKQPLKKSKLPQGRFDAPEDDNHLEKEPLTSKYSKAAHISRLHGSLVMVSSLLTA